MKPGRKPSELLTEKEMVIMTMLWDHGPMFAVSYTHLTLPTIA